LAAIDRSIRLSQNDRLRVIDMSAEPLIVLTTCGDPREAERLATELVEMRLAACVNALPQVASTYRWNAAVERSEEVLLLIKTTRERYPELEARIRSRSSYELPEVLAVPIAGGSPEYLGWIRSSLET
jgi:periplasmic divalent cation tolerance protein